MTLNAIEIKDIITFIVKNNIELAKEGRTPKAVEVSGASGIGKTSVIEQTAQELAIPFIKRNLAEMTIDDLVGYPIVLHQMCKEDKCKWIVKDGIEAYIASGWVFSGETEMSYSLPMWIRPYVGSDKPIILFLDDSNRAALNLIQAAMEICSRGEFLSWKLPKGSSVIMSSNPDDGSMMVTSRDEAHETRLLSYQMKFDADTWAMFAEKDGIDPRAINFILKNNEIVSGTNDFDEKGNKLKKGNIRLWTMFFETIRSIENWGSNLDLIMKLAGTNFPQEHILLFTSFIREEFDKLPTPSSMLDMKNSEEELLKELDELIIPKGDSKNFRADVASIISKRLMNYSMVNIDILTDSQLDRYATILERGIVTRVEGTKTIVEKAGLFPTDLIFLTLRKVAGNPRMAKNIVKRPALTASLIKS